MDTAELFSVAGKRVVVTGGSRGIGLMLAEAFVRAGARVLICARKADELERARAELAALGACTAVQADLSSLEGVRALAAAVAEWAGADGREPALEVLVNNAGATWGAPLGAFPEAGWDRVLDLNLKGTFFATQELLPLLRAAASADDPARVLNIGSVDGLVPAPHDNFPYSASKAALHMLTRQLAARLGPQHVTVNAIAPGQFRTRMVAFMHDDPEQRAEMLARIPLGRAGSPDDLAGAALFLASRAGAYVTAAVLPVDGGTSGTAN